MKLIVLGIFFMSTLSLPSYATIFGKYSPGERFEFTIGSKKRNIGKFIKVVGTGNYQNNGITNHLYKFQLCYAEESGLTCKPIGKHEEYYFRDLNHVLSKNQNFGVKKQYNYHGVEAKGLNDKMHTNLIKWAVIQHKPSRDSNLSVNEDYERVFDILMEDFLAKVDQYLD